MQDLHQEGKPAYARQDRKKVLEPRVKACSRPLGTKKGLQQRGKPAHGRQGRKKKDLHEGLKPVHGREERLNSLIGVKQTCLMPPGTRYVSIE